MASSLKETGYMEPVSVWMLLLGLGSINSCIINNYEGWIISNSRHIVDLFRHRKLYIQLCDHKNNLSSSMLKDNLANITRILVWDDQHQTDLFE